MRKLVSESRASLNLTYLVCIRSGEDHHSRISDSGFGAIPKSPAAKAISARWVNRHEFKVQLAYLAFQPDFDRCKMSRLIAPSQSLSPTNFCLQELRLESRRTCHMQRKFSMALRGPAGWSRALRLIDTIVPYAGEHEFGEGFEC